jgi:hypothetical protein
MKELVLLSLCFTALKIQGETTDAGSAAWSGVYPFKSRYPVLTTLYYI